MENLEAILKIVDGELSAITNNGKFRSREEIDSVFKLIDIAKDINKIWCMEEEMDGESYATDDMRRASYGGDSYARGRMNAKRDSMGRYSRDSYRGYSRDGKAEYISHLRDLMEDAPDEQTRQSLQRMIQQMG